MVSGLVMPGPGVSPTSPRARETPMGAISEEKINY